MASRFSFFVCLLTLTFTALSADVVVWSGDVKSDGSPSPLVKLQNGEKYFLKVSGIVNLGKWVQAGEKLATDACWEFSQDKPLDKIESLRNSHDVSVCDGRFHNDHIYVSEPFVAKQNRIHFWVYDTDYDDNNGSFHVEVILKTAGL